MKDAADIAGLTGPDAVVLTAPNQLDALTDLFDVEAAVVAKAIDKRKREFATGRALARAGLSRLGHHRVEIPTAPDRAPVWPEGFAGSISHCDTRAVVAVQRREVGTIGVDVEHRTELKTSIWESVFLPSELARLHAMDEDTRGKTALVLFSAKEALYKAQYPWTTTFMGFHELEVTLDSLAARGELRCTFQNDVGRFAKGTTVVGRYDIAAFDGPEIVTAVEIREEEISREPRSPGRDPT